MQCPCGSGQTYHDCCQPLVEQQQLATSPEALMRSRYSAFCLANTDYLVATHHPDFCSADLALGLKQDQTQWHRLQVIFSCSSQDEQTGIVEFKAYYREGEGLGILHERSNFVKQDGRWYYTDGEFSPASLKRNSACPCGSGKKLKQCCGKA